MFSPPPRTGHGCGQIEPGARTRAEGTLGEMEGYPAKASPRYALLPPREGADEVEE